MATQRKSVEESAKGGSGRAGGSGNVIKVVVVIVALCAATSLLLWHFGIIEFKKEPPPLTTEQIFNQTEEGRKTLEETQKVNEELKRRNVTPSGS